MALALTCLSARLRFGGCSPRHFSAVSGLGRSSGLLGLSLETAGELVTAAFVQHVRKGKNESANSDEQGKNWRGAGLRHNLESSDLTDIGGGNILTPLVGLSLEW